MAQLSIMVPLSIYLLLTVIIAFFSKKFQQKCKDTRSFIEEYFIGGRSMGGFVLAMSIVTSYTSASSFIGGPGVAYEFGLCWVFLSMIQLPAVFLTLGILGKRFAFMARKVQAITIIDFLRVRYQSDFLTLLCSIALFIFFISAMLAQCIGGARLFQAITGYSYEVGLIVFSIVLVLYTSIGGFRAVVTTDVLQGVIMIIGAIVILLAVINTGGGIEHCIHTLSTIDPGLITPLGPQNFLSVPMLCSFWVLIGIGVLGLPQTMHKCMGYKDSKSMHNAMFFGTIILGFMLLSMHLVGALGRAVLPDIPIGDLAVPSLALSLLPSFWSGIFIAAPLAAIMSTVDTMLFLLSAVIIKDFYIYYRFKGNVAHLSAKSIYSITAWCTVGIGVFVFILALNPPSLLVWINIFAFGGLEVVFFWPIILGLYWKKANAVGTISAILVGLSVFLCMNMFKYSPGNVSAIIPSLFLSGIVFFCGSYKGKAPSKEIIQLFWDEGREKI